MHESFMFSAFNRPNGPLFQTELERCYQSPGRAYHTLQHINEGFEEFGKLRRAGLIQNEEAFAFAWWCHDAVYRIGPDNVGGPSDEERSANFAVAWAETIGYDATFGELVRNHILATKHNGVAEKSDTKYFVDVDLSILGKPEERFDEYERQIRIEYRHVERDYYLDGRRALLKGFLPPKRSHIFFTEHMRAKYEDQAQNNLRRAISKLQRGILPEI